MDTQSITLITYYYIHIITYYYMYYYYDIIFEICHIASSLSLYVKAFQLI